MTDFQMRRPAHDVIHVDLLVLEMCSNISSSGVGYDL